MPSHSASSSSRPSEPGGLVSSAWRRTTSVTAVADSTVLDRESVASFALTVQVSDGTNTDTAVITINLTDVNEFAPVVNDATTAINENTANGTNVYLVAATDADLHAALTAAVATLSAFTFRAMSSSSTATGAITGTRPAAASVTMSITRSSGIS